MESTKDKAPPKQYWLHCLVCGDRDVWLRRDVRTDSEDCRVALVGLRNAGSELHCVICGEMFTPVKPTASEDGAPSKHTHVTCSEDCTAAHWQILNPHKSIPKDMKYDPIYTSRLVQYVYKDEKPQDLIDMLFSRREKKKEDAAKSEEQKGEEDTK